MRGDSVIVIRTDDPASRITPYLPESRLSAERQRIAGEPRAEDTHTCPSEEPKPEDAGSSKGNSIYGGASGHGVLQDHGLEGR